MSESADQSELVSFLCNICRSPSAVERGKLSREESSCSDCGSTVRMRWVPYALSVLLFGSPKAVPDFPQRRDLQGVGLSDWEPYAKRLAKRLDYRNTYYHQEPRLDIMNPEGWPAASLDFLISSDVFEHVPPPVEVAFDNAFRLLRPGGHLVLTVPYSLNVATVEHFPDLNDYRLIPFGDTTALVNRTQANEWQAFGNLVFHGGEGSTLEMRVLCESDLIHLLEHAGFTDIKIWSEDYLPFGIHWPLPWSLPVTARRPA